jgi:general secretion pathway protein I
MNSPRSGAVRPAMPASRPPRPRPRTCAGGARGARGFTLIEIVVAFAILALGLGLTMQIATGALRNARHAAQRTEAALYAKSLLDAAGVGERLEEGQDSGEFGEDYRWTLTVAKEEVEAEGTAGMDPSLSPVQLYRLELLVEWGEGRAAQEARFVTLRALTPDTGG